MGAVAEPYGGGGIMKDPQIDRAKTLRVRRGIVLFGSGALALAVGVTGGYAALAGGSSSLRMRQDPTVPFTSASPLVRATVTHTVSPSVTPAGSSPTAEPTSDPTALADGVYPTFVRAVDVQGATVTVDVLQTFFGGAAHQAAIEDGVPWRDVRYDPVYIRNENPLLRTLPVARDVQIKFMGVCMEPNRRVGLTELRNATTPLTDTFYYDVSVVAGKVEGITQKIAISAC